MRVVQGRPLSFLCCGRCAHSMARARRQPRARSEILSEPSMDALGRGRCAFAVRTPLTRDHGVTRPGGAKLKWNSTALLARKSPALVAQLDRAPDFESGGRGFESLRARQRGAYLGAGR